MKKSIEDIIKLVAVKQAAPPPTRLEKPSTVKEEFTEAHITKCGVTYPTRYDGIGGVRDIYRDILLFMYCRPQPDGTCLDLIPGGDDVGEIGRPEQYITDRDQPVRFQESHPEFNPNDPSTWGSYFEPGGAVEGMLRSYWCGWHGNNNGLNCQYSDADFNAMVGIIRQFYVNKCGFVTAQTGSCCEFSEFGTATCSQTTSFSCPGVFTAGGNCNGENPCGLAQNPVQQNDQGKKQTPIMDMVVSLLKRK